MNSPLQARCLHTVYQFPAKTLLKPLQENHTTKSPMLLLLFTWDVREYGADTEEKHADASCRHVRHSGRVGEGKDGSLLRMS